MFLFTILLFSFPLAAQSHPEAGREVQRHFKDSGGHHSERVPAAGHGEEEGDPAHQGPLQNRTERQPPLARAGATTHTRPVGVDTYLWALLLFCKVAMYSLPLALVMFLSQREHVQCSTTTEFCVYRVRVSLLTGSGGFLVSEVLQ